MPFSPDGRNINNMAKPAGNEIRPPASADGALPVETIDIAKVADRVEDSLVKKVGGIVEKHPEEALSVIRAWMNQDERNY